VMKDVTNHLRTNKTGGDPNASATTNISGDAHSVVRLDEVNLKTVHEDEIKLPCEDTDLSFPRSSETTHTTGARSSDAKSLAVTTSTKDSPARGDSVYISAIEGIDGGKSENLIISNGDRRGTTGSHVSFPSKLEPATTNALPTTTSKTDFQSQVSDPAHKNLGENDHNRGRPKFLSNASDGARSVFPDEKLLEKGNVYKLYRGILCYAVVSRCYNGTTFQVDPQSCGTRKLNGCISGGGAREAVQVRLWVDVYRMDLCVASLDSPALATNRFPINYLGHPVPQITSTGEEHQVVLEISKLNASFIEGDHSDGDITNEQEHMRPTRLRVFSKGNKDVDSANLTPGFPFANNSIDSITPIGNQSLGTGITTPNSVTSFNTRMSNTPAGGGGAGGAGAKSSTNKSSSSSFSPTSSSSKAPISSSPSTTVEGFKRFFDILSRLRLCFEQDVMAIYHIKRNVFQYLWRHQVMRTSQREILEGQAILAFNLDPKTGVNYLKTKVFPTINRDFDTRASNVNREIAGWLVRMSAAGKGGLDPSVLGSYFARKDTADVYEQFLRIMDFRKNKTNQGSIIEDADDDEAHGVLGIVAALRHLFNTFKPPGEMQILDRLLRHFADYYFTLLDDSEHQKGLHLRYTDTLHTLCFAVILINHELHMAPRLTRRNIDFVQRTVEQYTASVRETNISSDEVSDEYIRQIYEEVRDNEIQMHPLPRVPFSSLPVTPDIEGWLVVILKGRPPQRYWAVVAMQRLYLFSDSDEINAFLCIDLKNLSGKGVDKQKMSRLLEKRMCSINSNIPFPIDRVFLLGAKDSAPITHDVPPPISQGSQPMLQRVVKTFFGALLPQKLRWVLCVAESKDMMEKWSNSWV